MKMVQKFVQVCALAFSVVTAPLACAKESEASGSAKVGPTLSLTSLTTFPALLQAQPRFSLFLNLVRVCGMEPLLQGGSVKTLFAANNEAWTRQLGSNQVPFFCSERTQKLLQHQLLSNSVGRAAFLAGSALPTLSGGKIFVTAEGGELDGRARFVGDEVISANGVLHELSAVLVPDEFGRLDAAVEKRPYLSEIVALIKRFGLEGLARKQDNVTVLAPTNAALDAYGPLPGLIGSAGLLLSHLVPKFVSLGGFDTYPQTLLTWNKKPLSLAHDESKDLIVSLEPKDPAGPKAEARVIESVSTENGQLEVIDRVMTQE